MNLIQIWLEHDQLLTFLNIGRFDSAHRPVACHPKRDNSLPEQQPVP